MSGPSVVAAPEEGFVALSIPREMIPPLPPEATGHLIRIRSAEGFKNLMLAMIEAASNVWPEIAAEWRDVGGES